MNRGNVMTLEGLENMYVVVNLESILHALH